MLSSVVRASPTVYAALGGATSRFVLQQLHRTFSTAESRVKDITTDQEFQSELKRLADANKFAVVDFTAKWCGPCKAIAPVYERFSQQYPDVEFYRVDVDNRNVASTLTGENTITAVPTFAIYKGSKKVDSFAGARVDLLKEILDKHVGGSSSTAGQ
eukprot:jgi/Chrzof1/4763/Cz14g25110.t1_TRX1